MPLSGTTQPRSWPFKLRLPELVLAHVHCCATPIARLVHRARIAVRIVCGNSAWRAYSERHLLFLDTKLKLNNNAGRLTNKSIIMIIIWSQPSFATCTLGPCVNQHAAAHWECPERATRLTLRIAEREYGTCWGDASSGLEMLALKANPKRRLTTSKTAL
jgi:hypothetical protein